MVNEAEEGMAFAAKDTIRTLYGHQSLFRFIEFRTSAISRHQLVPYCNLDITGQGAEDRAAYILAA